MKRTVTIFLISLIATFTFAQTQQEILMTIGDKEITTEEFLRVYNKNSSITSETEKKGIDDYLDLFINYKLKVIEAENLGYDTLKAFVDEYNGYRKQLAKPYLENDSLKIDLIKEAYDRNLLEINASHILIVCKENASPEDTLKAFEKITAIRARVVGGEPFEEVAKATSDDPSVKENSGSLGYFSVFNMVYPFETAAYNTEKGQVSNIVRTSFGYHILKINDIIPNRGSMDVAHIMTRISPNASEPEIKAAKEKIDTAYLALMNGMSWDEAVQKYSENPRTRNNKGKIGWISAGKAPQEFLTPMYELKADQFSKPIKTIGGFHIGYVLSKKPIGSFEELKENLTKQVDRDQNRKKTLEELQLSELKKKYEVSTSPEGVLSLNSVIDSSIYDGNWNSNLASELNNTVLKIKDKIYTSYDYAKYVAGNSVSKNASMPISEIIESNFDGYVYKSIIDYAMKTLPKENPDYKYILQEYHDGILLFNLTNDLVWDKAQKDSVGLENFYKDAKKHQWNERITVNIYKYSDNSFTAKLPSLVSKQIKKKLESSYLSENLCSTDTNPCISLETKTFEKSQDSMADKLTWEKGSYILETDKDLNLLYYVVNTKGKEDKELNEARGLYIADYQTFLETNWIKELRAKYKIVLNEVTLEKLKAELKN